MRKWRLLDGPGASGAVDGREVGTASAWSGNGVAPGPLTDDTYGDCDGFSPDDCDDTEPRVIAGVVPMSHTSTMTAMALIGISALFRP